VQTTYGIDELQVVEDRCMRRLQPMLILPACSIPVVTPALVCQSIKFKEAVLVFMPVLSYYHCVMGMKKRPPIPIFFLERRKYD